MIIVVRDPDGTIAGTRDARRLLARRLGAWASMSRGWSSSSRSGTLEDMPTSDSPIAWLRLPTRSQARSAVRRLRTFRRRRGPAVTSTAVVATDRPLRYGRQLVAHLGRHADGRWEEGSAHGSIEFGGGGDRADLTCGPDTLTMVLTAQPHALTNLEHVLGAHLARFGAKDGLVVAWTRADGTPGTTQPPPESR